MKIAIPCLLALACSTSLAVADPVIISSGSLTVTCDPTTHELAFLRNDKPFAEHVKPWDGLGTIANIQTQNIKDPDITGKSILIEGTGGAEEFALLDGIPFIVAHVYLRNTGALPLIVHNIIPFSAPLTVKPANFFTPEGNSVPLPGETSSYFFLAAVDPATRAGVVTGWLTHDTGSGIIGAKTGDQITLEPRAEYGKHPLAPGQTLQSESIAIGDFDDARLGLEALADANAKANDIHLRPIMSGYCTWYHAHASNEKDLKALADFAVAQHLKDYGFDFLQIDDGWQTARRDFSTFNTAPKATYPAGMKATADGLIADGFVAGIWLTPFAWDAKILKDHPDYFVKTPEGKPYSVKWAGDCLDMTNPDAVAYLSDIIHRITHDWDYKYLKIDGLWAGSATTILYPNPAYKPDDYGNALFHDPAATNISAYRAGLRAVREAAGNDVFICGCNVAQNHRTLAGSIGLVDAMRVGPDINATWDSIATRAAVFAAREYFLNGRVWWNDPDCLMLRNPLTLDQARAWGSFIAISGMLNVVSEDLAKLPPEKFDIVKRTMPNLPHEARPLDLFTQKQPTIWQTHLGSGETAHDLVGLFNWDNAQPSAITLDPKALGLDPAATYIGFDFWENQFVDTFSGTKEFSIRPSSCRVLNLVKSENRPQLVSTSRHVLQGSPDLIEVKWDAATNTLSGKSKVIADDPYELRIATGPYTLENTKTPPSDTVGSTTSTDPGHVRVKFSPTTTGEMEWHLAFTPQHGG
jgi:Melibiase